MSHHQGVSQHYTQKKLRTPTVCTAQKENSTYKIVVIAAFSMSTMQHSVWAGPRLMAMALHLTGLSLLQSLLGLSTFSGLVKLFRLPDMENNFKILALIKL